MVNGISATNVQTAYYAGPQNPQRLTPKTGDSAPRDTVEFGSAGVLTDRQTMSIVLERAMQKLYSVVEDARAALGIPDDAVIDTSPEATAGRIADFALGAFGKWWDNHGELGEEEARTQFADFIGGAISQGIEEARGILGALNALTPEVDGNIDRTAELIQQRLKDFVDNGIA